MLSWNVRNEEHCILNVYSIKTLNLSLSTFTGGDFEIFNEYCRYFYFDGRDSPSRVLYLINYKILIPHYLEILIQNCI